MSSSSGSSASCLGGLYRGPSKTDRIESQNPEPRNPKANPSREDRCRHLPDSPPLFQRKLREALALRSRENPEALNPKAISAWVLGFSGRAWLVSGTSWQGTSPHLLCGARRLAQKTPQNQSFEVPFRILPLCASAELQAAAVMKKGS